jgi:CheY-like chemotaxis protein
MELEAAPFEVAQLVESALSVVRLTAQRKGLRLEVDIDRRLPAWLVGDASRVRQVLVNLLGNAVKFTEQGSVTLSLAVEDAGPERTRVRFGVRDTGIGIPADKHDRIFGAFTQADGSTTRRFGGTGLGLTISLRLVGLMGGKLEIDSEVGRGSLFHFAVDLGVHAGAALEEPRARMAALAATSRSGLRVLLAEDNKVNQRVAARFLERLGHSVVVANDGREAVERWREQPFDLVLMDVQMPRMDGFEATAAIRAHERAHGGHLRIVAMTAHALKGDAERCLEAGMDDYLSKPLSAPLLYATVEADPAEVVAGGTALAGRASS